MAYDEGLASILRDDLIEVPGITEKKMFGGLCFLQFGHMVCGIHKDGAMFRVGKPNHDQAMAIEGSGPMMFTGRAMGGMIDVSQEALADDNRRGQWMALALANAASLPPK